MGAASKKNKRKAEVKNDLKKKRPEGPFFVAAL
ncbi:hypothetical protein PMO01_16725 [Pseudomonas moraviensis R28-S]|jgi:hypothetical protein|uniref:Uncharacterized protein n=1 Tax=Pseudomonas moraviensis R28-S TaxID=1395516 RepID=V8R8F2_9PSED|nr:hypothetical protein PMO01_16725 [Pseudomonas moraviensis R28-S]